MNPIEFPKIFFGTDIVEVRRINKLSDKLGRKFLDRIFLPLPSKITVMKKHLRVYTIQEGLQQKNL